MTKLWLLFSVVLLASCASKHTGVSASGNRPMPMPGPIVTATGEPLASAAVVQSKQPNSIITTSGDDKKTVELDGQRTEFDYDDPSKSKLILLNTKPSEAYLIYPSASKFTGDLGSTNFSSANFTIYPTKDPVYGLAKGTFEWAMIGIDWNKPEANQQVTIQDRNFNPGATILFGDRDYAYSLIPGYVVKGKGVKFVIPSPTNPYGIQLLPDTTISILRQSRRYYDCWPLKGA